MSREKDLTGQRFGRLVVIEKAGRYVSPHGKTATIWLCQCRLYWHPRCTRSSWE